MVNDFLFLSQSAERLVVLKIMNIYFNIMLCLGNISFVL